MCSISGRPPMPEPMTTPTRSRVALVDGEPRVLERELRGGEGEVDEEVALLDLFLVGVVERVEALDLAGDARRVVGGVEAGDRADAADRPSMRACQFSAVPTPRGDTRPTPVTTTRRRSELKGIVSVISGLSGSLGSARAGGRS